MNGEVYKNRFEYMQKMHDFMDRKITAEEFERWFMRKRDADIDQDIANGYYQYYENKVFSGNELKFQKKYSNYLYHCQPPEDEYWLSRYSKGVEKYNITGETLFLPLYDLLSVKVRDLFHYWNTPAELFDPNDDIEEEELRWYCGEILRILEKYRNRLI